MTVGVGSLVLKTGGIHQPQPEYIRQPEQIQDNAGRRNTMSREIVGIPAVKIGELDYPTYL